jgi:F420-dependent oxidoreductase-like protein
MQIPARTPTMTAMTAASLDVLTGGRFRLGLGVSGPQVSEGWHGVRFAQPLVRTREYLTVVEAALSRRTVTFDGAHYQLPLPDGPGKALKLMLAPVSEHIAIYLAAVGPRNLELAGELADGWLSVFYAAEFAAEQLTQLATGRSRVGKDLIGFDIVPTFPLVVGTDLRSCADPVRPYAALYLGGMGSREKNFYNALAVRMGYAKEAAEIQDLYLAKKHREAMAAVPHEFIDSISLLGGKERIADKLTAYAENGVTTLALTPFEPTVEGRIGTLRTVSEALDLAGIGD